MTRCKKHYWVKCLPSKKDKSARRSNSSEVSPSIDCFCGQQTPYDKFQNEDFLLRQDGGFETNTDFPNNLIPMLILFQENKREFLKVNML